MKSKKYTALFYSGLFILNVLAAKAFSEPFSFAVIGDLPYGVEIKKKDKQIETLIHQLNSDPSLSWVLHIGDIKMGGSLCSNAMIEDRIQRFASIKAPFVYTPGDNEWTDCHHVFTGGYDPLDRLNFLRKSFFNSTRAQHDRQILGVTQQSKQQPLHADFIENYHWEKQGVHFITAHVVGSLNGRAPLSTFAKVSPSEAHKNEITAREKAAIDWLQHAFKRSRLKQASALVIAIHANPSLSHSASKEEKQAFHFFTKQLAKQLKSFHKPVLLIHGDSHYMRIDKPKLNGKHAPHNFVRLESFGENNQAWIKVTADPNSTQVFSFSIYDQVAD